MMVIAKKIQDFTLSCFHAVPERKLRDAAEACTRTYLILFQICRFNHAAHTRGNKMILIFMGNKLATL